MLLILVCFVVVFFKKPITPERHTQLQATTILHWLVSAQHSACHMEKLQHENFAAGIQDLNWQTSAGPQMEFL